MNSNLAPTHIKMFGDYWVLWYSISNSYSIITHEFKLLLDTYLVSQTKLDFLATLSKNLNTTEHKDITDYILNYLDACNQPLTPLLKSSDPLDTSHRHILKQYSFEDKHIQVYYSSELVLKTVHPAIAYYSVNSIPSTDTTFDIYLKDEYLHLLKDAKTLTSVPKRNYHLIQGKFIMHLLCELHNKAEQDWIGTLHGSTITDNNSSILFIGKSGKGKSTLCALLAANGYNLLADDVSPLLSEDQHIYYNPSSISIKEGAFNMLQTLVKDFNEIPVVEFNKTKGKLKYMPCDKPKQNHFPCIAIILVNYDPESETILEQVSIKQILETIIEDSWLSSNPKHALQFLDWLEKKKLYQLTYSNTQSVLTEISRLFKELKEDK